MQFAKLHLSSCVVIGAITLVVVVRVVVMEYVNLSGALSSALSLLAR